MAYHDSLQALQARRKVFDQAAEEWAQRPFDQCFSAAKVEDLAIDAGARVLDLGCGTGHIFPLLWRIIGTHGHIDALDLSREMLRHAASTQYPPTNLICGAAETLPLKDGLWDAVICLGVFPHFTDRAAALREIYRILRPGGRLAILHLLGREQLNALHQQVGGVIAEDLLPGAHEVSRLLEVNNYRVDQVYDGPDCFRVVATKL